jgi:hypothetical protein
MLRVDKETNVSPEQNEDGRSPRELTGTDQLEHSFPVKRQSVM